MVEQVVHRHVRVLQAAGNLGRVLHGADAGTVGARHPDLPGTLTQSEREVDDVALSTATVERVDHQQNSGRLARTWVYGRQERH